MFKRLQKNKNNEYSIPAKKPKYNVNKETTANSVTKHGDAVRKSSIKCEDLWGDDFADEEIEEMDFVASQVTQEVNNYSQTFVQQNVSFAQRCDSEPSTSKAVSTHISAKKVSNCPVYMQQSNLDKWKAKDPTETTFSFTQANYMDFENMLKKKEGHNSTFKSQEKIVETVTEDAHLQELEQLRLQNKKLLSDFITKEGEATFLRKQLQQTQSRAQNDNQDKIRIMDEQSKKFKSEINTISKERDHLKTQLELQTFEVGNLMERCRLLESRNVKLVEPHAVHLNSTPNKSKLTKVNTTINRFSTSNKSANVKETSVQTDVHIKNSYFLKTWSPNYPLSKFPKFLYDTPQPEKSVVNIQIIEKTGRRNLPILQEEETFRIFENPELVKPVTTMIDDRKLTTQFILPEMAALQKKTDSELESDISIPMINKLVATTRELIINMITVLQTIFRAMRNDDIRDMNDIYFSELYSNPNLTAKSICDANAWHEDERGVEARRALGALSYVTSHSAYLSNYITGKTKLLTERDESYKRYSKQMIRYDTWSDKGHEFEMLQMILQFVVLVGTTRRSHQFSGLICAIAMVTYNTHNKVGYCRRGMEYVFQIFREIVFSRPLPYSYVLLNNMMTIFIKSSAHLQKLCVNSHSMAVQNWKDTLHFTPDACPLQIFLAQMENYNADLISTVDITHALLMFVQYLLQTNVIPLRSENPECCNCCLKLVRFTIRMLCRCSEVNLNAVEHTPEDCSLVSSDASASLQVSCAKRSASQVDVREKCFRETCRERISVENSWTFTKRRQFKVWRDGIRFFCHLAIWDPDFVMRFSDIEDSFHTFLRNISVCDNFVLHENEKEAMDRIKQTFVFDKTPQSDAKHYKYMANQLNILSNFETSTILPASASTKRKENYSEFLSAIRSLDNVTMEL